MSELTTDVGMEVRCFRGIDTLTAMTILAKLHDFRRFDDPRRLLSSLPKKTKDVKEATRPVSTHLNRLSNR